MMCALAHNACRKRRPVAAQAAQLHAGRIDQTDAIADFAPIASLQLSHQNRKQPVNTSTGRLAFAVDSADRETVQPPR